METFLENGIVQAIIATLVAALIIGILGYFRRKIEEQKIISFLKKIRTKHGSYFQINPCDLIKYKHQRRKNQKNMYQKQQNQEKRERKRIMELEKITRIIKGQIFTWLIFQCFYQEGLSKDLILPMSLKKISQPLTINE